MYYATFVWSHVKAKLLLPGPGIWTGNSCLIKLLHNTDVVNNIQDQGLKLQLQDSRLCRGRCAVCEYAKGRTGKVMQITNYKRWSFSESIEQGHCTDKGTWVSKFILWQVFTTMYCIVQHLIFFTWPNCHFHTINAVNIIIITIQHTTYLCIFQG